MPKIHNIEDYTGDNYNPDATERMRRRDRDSSRKKTIEDARKDFNTAHKAINSRAKPSRKR